MENRMIATPSVLGIIAKKSGRGPMTDPRPRLHISPQRSRLACRGRWIDFPPEIDMAVCNELRGIENMSERFSVCLGSLSPFVGCKLP
jgi:hypothetical protein